MRTHPPFVFQKSIFQNMRMKDIVTLGRLSLTTTLSSTITGEFLTTTFTKTKKDQESMQIQEEM